MCVLSRDTIIDSEVSLEADEGRVQTLDTGKRSKGRGFRSPDPIGLTQVEPTNIKSK